MPKIEHPPAKADKPKPKRADKPAPYSTLSKDQLVSLRTQYLTDLAKPVLTATVRMAIQQELAMIKSALKVINSAQAARDYKAAQQRRASGMALHQEQLQSAIANANPSAPGVTLGGGAFPITPVEPTDDRLPASLATAPPAVQQNGYPKGIQTLGGFILMRAEQLRAAIRRLRADKAEHTTVFIAQLDAFIGAQDAMVKIEREARGKISGAMRMAVARGAASAEGSSTTLKRSDPVVWKETWEGDS